MALSEMQKRRLKDKPTGKGKKVPKGTQKKMLERTSGKKSSPPKKKRKRKNTPFSAHGATQTIRKRQMTMDKI